MQIRPNTSWAYHKGSNKIIFTALRQVRQIPGYLVVLLMRSPSAYSLAKMWCILPLKMYKERNRMGKEEIWIYRHEGMIIFTGKTKWYWMIFQLSLAHSYFQSYVTLLLLLPWKMFSSCSMLNVAQRLLATFPRFYSWKVILSASFQPFTSFRETRKRHLALCKGISDSTQWVWCWKYSMHWRHWSAGPHGSRGCCLSVDHVDFSVYKPPLQNPGLLSFPSKQHFIAKRW